MSRAYGKKRECRASLSKSKRKYEKCTCCIVQEAMASHKIYCMPHYPHYGKGWGVVVGIEKYENPNTPRTPRDVPQYNHST